MMRPLPAQLCIRSAISFLRMAYCEPYKANELRPIYSLRCPSYVMLFVSLAAVAVPCVGLS